MVVKERGAKTKAPLLDLRAIQIDALFMREVMGLIEHIACIEVGEWSFGLDVITKPIHKRLSSIDDCSVVNGHDTCPQ